jgi:two-component system response regulator YesN
MNKYRCIVVEDESLIRRDLIHRITACDPAIDVVGEAIDGMEAMKLVETLAPDIVVTDVQIPALDGLELTQNIRFYYPSIQIVIISGHDDFKYMQKALRYHVVDYLLKPITDAALKDVFSRIRINLSNLPANAGLSDSQGPLLSAQEAIVYIQNYISEHYSETFTLEEAANHIQYSAISLSRIYKKATHQTPLQYLIDLRIREACRLLLSDPSASIATVGERLGYEDTPYFSRMFRKYMGVYPGEYRARRRELPREGK